jgi:Fuc2NAc and GlcNAc transferase
MAPEVTFLIVATLPVSCMLTYAARRRALSSGLLDIPNPRSSHLLPTPRGGGLAIVLATTVGFALLAVIGAVDRAFYAALLGGLAVGIVGLADDRHVVRPGIRLTVHFAAALWALVWLGGLPALQIGDKLFALGRAGYLLGAMGVVWTLNLFNFMDGIDGIAASEGVFVACAGAAIALAGGQSHEIPSVALLFGAACLGFLVWNWPPAKIFMGDVGSGYVGYVLALLALGSARDSPVALLVWSILGGVFIVDATVTIARRMLRGDRIYEAHRTHAYQWISRRWRSHRRTTVAVMVVNLVWLLPCASLAAMYPTRAVWIAAVALVPLTGLALAAGAGRPERAGEDAGARW